MQTLREENDILRNRRFLQQQLQDAMAEDVEKQVVESLPKSDGYVGYSYLNTEELQRRADLQQARMKQAAMQKQMDTQKYQVKTPLPLGLNFSKFRIINESSHVENSTTTFLGQKVFIHSICDEYTTVSLFTNDPTKKIIPPTLERTDMRNLTLDQKWEIKEAYRRSMMDNAIMIKDPNRRALLIPSV